MCYTISTIKEIAEKREITKILRKYIKTEKSWEKVYPLCIHLAKCCHAPIYLKDYKKMEKYAQDDILVSLLYEGIKNYFLLDTEDYDFDVIGHSYCVALLSQANILRKQILEYFDKFTDILININATGYGHVMYRNMKRLSKEYPDLKELEIKLICFEKYK